MGVLRLSKVEREREREVLGGFRWERGAVRPGFAKRLGIERDGQEVLVFNLGWKI